MSTHTEKTSTKGLAAIIGASSVGTLIEWYDFYIFGSLATIISTQFFPKDNPTAAFLSTLATFAAGFVVRPFGALFFGRLGDLIGRKYTFMVTLVLMGGATFAIGLVPKYETIGFFAPLLVLVLRLLQGLALGGEYGGAATYVAEHSPAGQRGFWTSWIQITATAGLFISLGVILVTKNSMEKASWEDWGWRIPFLVSIIMVYVSVLIRKNMSESPLFAKAKAEGKTSVNPLKESFGNKLNFKYVLLALFGATMGQGVVWYTGQFYAQTFLLKIMNIDFDQANTLLIIALMMGTPFFVLFGWLSDRIGRKGIMLTGMLLGVLCYRPIYEKMYQTTNLKNKEEITAETKVETKRELVANSTTDSLITTTTNKAYVDGTTYKEVKKVTILAGKDAADQPKADVTKTVKINDSDKWTLIMMVFIQLIFVTMAYGPIAAFLVEMFPVKIRYTSMSLPYHIGNGVFGGLMPAIATYLVSTAKDANDAAEKAGQAIVNAQPYLEGLKYPMIVAGVCFVIGLLYIKEDKSIRD
ncbi:putative MFS family arabinose efflux permease [Arcicella aurantiaca]|uniref:Putative MFS family arabinose efflux permease n=1 Tax=Arcicella aurantiaca TaxID=591202 RepID=A0A316EFT7_9BACT|nr:MFS transporter [Arcicella aurantiaca]PWK28563.1 putative MFS family arabinose efflux permease [Arcicella aurantiaca]